MNKEGYIKKIKKYKGRNDYILTLQNKINVGEDINILQLALVDKILKKDSRNKKIEQKKETKKNTKQQLTLYKKVKITNDEIKSYFPSLFDYQIEGIKWLIEPKPYRWLLDEQGLGKTIQCIISAIILGGNKNVVICPNFLKINWLREIQKITDDVQIINDINIHKLKKFNIVNYDSIHKFSLKLISQDIDVCIIDESQFVKHTESRRHLYTKSVSNSSKRVWALTGTAKDNKLFDLFGQLQILKHPLGENKYYFGSRYCNTNEDNPYDFSGAKNLRELHNILFSTLALRRTKDYLRDVLDDKLPNHTIYYELESFRKYFQLLKEYKEKTESEEVLFGSFTHLTQINILKQFLAQQKLHLNKELIDNILDTCPNEKVVIFSNYTTIINGYHELYKDISLIHDGNTIDKQFVLDEFNNNPQIKILICQYQNSHAGLNLQIANHSLLNEMPQTPGVELQTKDRTHRIGQKNLTNFYYPMFVNTIDETLYLLFQEEHKISQNVIDGNENIIEIDLYKKLHASILKSII